jgi:hypothetical protein
VPRPAAVVDEADDGPHPEVAQAGQALVGPRPVDDRGVRARRALLPQHRVAQGADAEPREAFEVAGSRDVAVALELAEVGVVHAVDRALHPTPHLEGGRGGRRPGV